MLLRFKFTIFTFTTGSPITLTNIQKRKKNIKIRHFRNVSFVINVVVKTLKGKVFVMVYSLKFGFMSENVLYLSVELELKIISSTGCTIILSGDHEFPARAKCL